jgi:signal transduction histidine kinase
MSDLPRSEPSTEPRGLRLPYGPPGAGHTFADQLGRLRSQLITTAVIAGCLIVLLAAAGFGSIAAGWLPTTNVAFGTAAGTVLVGAIAALRVYFLFRELEEVPLPLPVPAHHEPEPWAHQQPVAQQQPQPAPPLEVRPHQATPAMVAAPAFSEGIQQWGDVFGKLSRRLQSLVNRLIRSIDRMEHELEDPDLLDMLWSIDHLATLVRRQAENIAVLGGETLERRSDNPVDVNAVLRSSVAEIQRYRQVVTIPIRDARIHGHVVAEIIHLLSELLDNATSFSSDEAPKVAFRAQYVTAGLAIQVQDRGIGMDAEDLRRINHLLDRDTHIDVGELFKDGRIGLAVVKELARRHHIGVELQPNIYGGIDASIVIPHKLIDRASDVASSRRGATARETAPSQPVRSAPPKPAHRAAVQATPSLPSLPPARPPAPQPAAPRQAPQPAARAATHAAPQPAQQAAQSAPQPSAAQSKPVSVPAPQPMPRGVAARPQPVAAQQVAKHATRQTAPTDGTADNGSRDNGSRDNGLRDNGQAGNGHAGPDEALPSRERGTAFAALRAGLPVGSEAAAAPQAAPQPPAKQAPAKQAPIKQPPIKEPPADQRERPALPQRREQASHLRPELRGAPVLTRPIPGHSTNLLADLQLGRVAGQQEIDQHKTDSPPSEPSEQPQRPDERDTEGEKGPWPTI